METEELEINGLRLVLHLPDRGCSTVVFWHPNSEGELGCVDFPDWASVSILGVDWNSMLSPWPAAGLQKGRGSFSGLGGEYLRRLECEIVPEAERAMGLSHPGRVIAGYSLAGLFALYSLFESECFDSCASVSGSLWYDGFVGYARTHQMKKPDPRVYLSLGDRECFSRNVRLASVQACTQEVFELLKGRGIDTVFESNAGGHFADVGQRMKRAFDWLRIR